MTILCLYGIPAMRGIRGATKSQIWPTINQISRSTQFRHLHAQWTYLLDYSWVFKDTGNSTGPLTLRKCANGLTESDVSCEDPDAQTVLFLHDAFADKSMGMSLAKEIIDQVFEVRNKTGSKVPSLQGLMVNIRGSGDSSSDDYDNAHTLPNAAEDVLTLVQAVCTGRVRSPSIIIAYGTLGRALAHFYVQATTSNGGVTRSTHSEVTGEGAVTSPGLVVLMPNTNTIEANPTTGVAEVSTQSAAYRFEEEVSIELLDSAREYLKKCEPVQDIRCTQLTSVSDTNTIAANLAARNAVERYFNIC